MNKKQIIDEAYNNFVTTVENNRPEGYRRKVLTQEEFVKNSIIDSYFSKHWGLKIEERALSLEERIELLNKKSKEIYIDLIWSKDVPSDRLNGTLEQSKIPTKLTTITYKDKTIESYE